MRKNFFAEWVKIVALCTTVMAFFLVGCNQEDDVFSKGGAEVEVAEKKGLADVYGSNCRYAGETTKENSLEGTTLTMSMESTMKKNLEFSYQNGKETKVDSAFVCTNSMKVESFTSVQVENLADVEGKTFEIEDGAFRPGKSVMPVTIAEPQTSPTEWSFTLASGEKETIELCKVSLYNGTLAFGKSRKVSDLIYKVAVTVTAYAEEGIESIYTDSLLVTEAEKDEVVYSARFVSYGYGIVNYEWQETHTLDTDLNKDWTPAVAPLPWTMSSSVTPAEFVETGEFSTSSAKNFVFGTESYTFEHKDVVSSANIVATVNSLTVEPESGKIMAFALPTDQLVVANPAVTVVSSSETENERTTVYEVSHSLETSEGVVVLSSKAQATGRKEISHEEEVTFEDKGDGTGEIIVIYDDKELGRLSFSFGYGISALESKEVNPASSFTLTKGAYTKGSNWTGNEKYEVSSNLGTLTAVKQSRTDKAAYNLYIDTNVEVKQNRNFVFFSAKTGKEYKIEVKDAETSISLVEGEEIESADKAQLIKSWTVNYVFGTAKASTAVKLVKANEDAIISREKMSEKFIFDNGRLFKEITVKESHKIPANNREYSFKRDLNLSISNNGQIISYEEIEKAVLSGSLIPSYGAQTNEGDSIVRRSVRYTHKANLGNQIAEVYIDINDVISYRGSECSSATVNVNGVQLGSVESTSQDGIYSIANHTNTWSLAVEANHFESKQAVKIYKINLPYTIDGWRVISGSRTHVFFNKTANGYNRRDVLVFAEIGNESHKRIYAFDTNTKAVLKYWETSDEELSQLAAGERLSLINLNGNIMPAILVNATDKSWETSFAYYALQESGSRSSRTKVIFSDATTSLKEFACPWEADLQKEASDIYSLGSDPKNYYR